MSLKDNYKDDVLNTSVNTRRKFRMIKNPDGTVSFEDVTEYAQIGDELSADDINMITSAINDYITNAEIDALDDDISDVPDGENILLQLAEKVENKADSMSLDEGFLQLTSEGRKIGTAVSLPEGGGDGEGTVIETIDNTEIEDLFEEE